MRYRSILTLLALLIAVPAFAQPPNRIDVVTRVADADPARFACAHTDRACAYDFIQALVCELRAGGDTRWGMNGRRGDPGRPSWDAVNWCGGGPATDPTGGCAGRLTIVDVIGGAGGPNPRPAWLSFDSDPTAGAFLVPTCSVAPTPNPTPTPTPTPQPPAPTVDLAPVLAKLDALAAQVAALQAAQGEQGMSLALALEAAQRAAHNAEQGALAVLDVKNWLDAGLLIELRVPTFGGTARGTARRPE